MAAASNKDVVRRFFGDIADNTNPAASEELIAPGYVGHFTGAPGPLDRAGALGFMGVFQAAFPGVTHTIEELIAEGDRVSARIVVRGTHRQDFMGMPPTGRSFAIASVNTFRIAGGKIAEQHAVFDSMGMLQQLGMLPDPGQAPA
jgi:steroid delta-isomerase-like uncharacterized protein